MSKSDSNSRVTPHGASEGSSPTDFLHDEVINAMVITRWTRVSLLVRFLCGFLDRFSHEDEEVYLAGFRDPKTHKVYLTHIREKR